VRGRVRVGQGREMGGERGKQGGMGGRGLEGRGEWNCGEARGRPGRRATSKGGRIRGGVRGQSEGGGGGMGKVGGMGAGGE